MYNKTGLCFTFQNTTAVNITTGRIDCWLTSPTLSDTLLKFQTVKTLRLMPFRNLELQNAPTKIEFQRPILQTDPVS